MFAKPAKASGNALLKGKDAKKLRRDAATRFSRSIDGADDPKLAQLLPSKAAVKKIQFQAPSRMVVYAVENEPLLFDETGKGDLCFSVYALWKSPELMPRLEVHAPVSQFVLRGADVMLPGVVFRSAEDVASLRKGELRAVFARGNPAAIAVGEVLVDADDIARTGKKGRALKLWHVVGDELWKMGPQIVPNDGFVGDRVVPIDAEGAAVESDDGEEEDNEEEVGSAEKDGETALSADGIQLEDKSDEDGEEKPAASEEVSKEDMDALYVSTLLQALKSGKIKEKELPMLASTFHATILLPCRRVNTSLNLKQSSFKKLSVFLAHMQHRGFLSFTENNGVQSITAISRRHPDVIAHELYVTDEQFKLEEEAAAAVAGGRSIALVPGQHAPQVEESLGLNPGIKSLFSNLEHVDISKKYWTPVEVRDAVTKYIADRELVDPQNQKFVRLDPSLTDALFGKKAPVGGYPNRMARPDILNSLLGKCTRYHRIILYPGHEPKFHGGAIRPIAIHAERSKRHNSSVITSIAFYQQFGIDGAAFAKEAQKKWGCAASAQPSEDKQKVEEIHVHGQMVNEVLDYLASKYQINTTKYCTTSYGKNVKPKKKK